MLAPVLWLLATVMFLSLVLIELELIVVLLLDYHQVKFMLVITVELDLLSPQLYIHQMLGIML